MGLLVDDVINIQFEGRLFEQQVITSFQYLVTSMVPNPNSVIQDLTSICLAVNGSTAGTLYQKYRLAISETVVDTDVRCQQIQPVRSAQVRQDPLNIVNGRGTCSTANLAYVITKGTDLGSRGQVGSVHLPGLADADLDEGAIEATEVVVLRALATEMLATITVPAIACVLTPVLYHPPIKPKDGKPGRVYSTDKMTRCFPQTTARTMRRRTLRIGS